MLLTNVQEALSEYRDGLAAVLGEQLDRIILYGSQARGDAEASSDIDVLCVTRGPFDYAELMRSTSKVTAAISLQYGVVLSRSFVTCSDFETRQLPFLMNVRREGIVV